MSPINKKRKIADGNLQSGKRLRPDSTDAASVQSGAKKTSTSLETLPWTQVPIPDRFEDAEGFFGLEEIEDVEIVKDEKLGRLEYRHKPNSSKQPGSLLLTQEYHKKGRNDEEELWEGFSDSIIQEQTTLSAPIERETPSVTKKATKPKKARKNRQKTSLSEAKDPNSGAANPFDLLSDETGGGVDVTAWQFLRLSSQTLSSLSRLKFSSPTPIQACAIPEILQGHDVIGKAVTGSGKTLAFGIPILEHFLRTRALEALQITASKAKKQRYPPVALILSPTRELAHQISSHLNDLCSDPLLTGPSIVTLTGGLSLQKQERLLANADIIIGTPGRLWEMISGGHGLKKWLSNTKYLVIDEADRLLSEGHFQEVEQILNALDRVDDGYQNSHANGDEDGVEAGTDRDIEGEADTGRQTLVFSATFQKDLQQKLAGKSKAGGELMDKRESMEYLLKKLKFREEKPKFVDVNPISQMASTLKEGIVECAGLEKDLYLYALLLHYPGTRTLIFTNSITSVRRLTPFLHNLNIPAHALHSQMPQKARLRSIERFSSPSSPSSILIATDVAARGLDIPSVQLVIHYHLPRAADMYVHRSGRTARASNSGSSIILCAPEEVLGVRRLVAKVHARNNKDDGKKFFMRTIELDRRIVARLKPRVTLSKKISDASLAKEKQSHNENWLRTAAEDLGVNYESSEFEASAGGQKGRGQGRKKAEKESRALSKGELGALKAELRQMLSQRVNVGVSERYLTAGGVDIDELLSGVKSKSPLCITWQASRINFLVPYGYVAEIHGAAQPVASPPTNIAFIIPCLPLADRGVLCFLLNPDESTILLISWFAMQSFITELPSPTKVGICNNFVPDVTERKWTATRCNRLLRPLSSKLALLRREQQLLHLGEQERKLSRCTASVPGNFLRMDNESDEIAAKSEEGWPGPRPKRGIKRTYSSRDVAQARRKRIAGPQIDQLDDTPLLGIPIIGMPLPVWKDQIREFDQASLNHTAVDLSLSASATLSKHAGFQMKNSHDRLVRAEHLKLIERISSGLGSFLRATSDFSTSVAYPSGTRSLFSTCLRRVPEYISDEELGCKAEESDNAIGISSAIYNDLEAFGSSPRGGWKPLREVVRSHGISLLGAAINQGHITAAEARYFVNVCLRCRAFDEAERLVEYILNAANRTLTSPSPVISVFDLVTLDLFARITFRYGFQYRQLTRLLRHGYLPCGWMSGNEMVPCWNRLIASLTKANNESIDAAILLRTALSMGYQVSGLPFAASQIHSIRLHAKGLLRSDGNLYNPNGKRSPSNDPTLNEDLDKAFCATSLHLLTVLTKIEIIPSLTSLLETNGLGKVDVLQDLALDVLQAVEVNEFETNSGKASQLPRHHDRLYLPVLAAGMVLATVGKREHELSQGIYQHLDLLKCLKTSQEFVDTAASFICTIVNCCGQAGSGDDFYYIQEIVNLLTRRQLFCLGSNFQTRRLSEQIAVSAAVRFSQATSLPKHLSWALDLESTFHCVRIGHERQTPIKSSERRPRNGYKWEEGICEWVAGTPCIPTPKPKAPSITTPIIFDQEGGAILPSYFYPTPSPSISEEDSLSPRLVPCGGNDPGEISDCLRTSPSKLSSSEWFLRVEITHSSRRKCEKILQAPIQKNSSNEEIPPPACPPLARIATHVKPLLTKHPLSQENTHQIPSSLLISKSTNRISTKKRHRPLLQILSSSSCITTKTSRTRRIPLAAVDTNNALSTVESEDELGFL